ncbi:MAG: SRPBCC family protein [Pseudomonas sp.]
MALIELRVSIAAARARVYQVSQDYAVRYEWDPFPERIEFMGELQAVQRGARVLVIARNGLRMEVEFVQVDAPQRAAIRMLRGPFFLRLFAGSWIFHERGAQETEVVFRYQLQIKRWALPWLVEPLAAWYFRRAVAARLQGLKVYCERTG